MLSHETFELHFTLDTAQIDVLPSAFLRNVLGSSLTNINIIVKILL